MPPGRDWSGWQFLVGTRSHCDGLAASPGKAPQFLRGREKPGLIWNRAFKQVLGAAKGKSGPAIAPQASA